LHATLGELAPALGRANGKAAGDFGRWRPAVADAILIALPAV
jgi:hypothetical protein